jgi:hypothetical protein
MKKSVITPILLTVVLVSLGVITVITFGNAQTSGTNVGGTIAQDTVWNPANSPYTLTQNVLINNGATLTIKPGTTVYLNDHSIEVKGTLNAIGASNNQINFIALTPTLWSSLGVIYFMPGSSSWNEQTQTGSTIQYSVITYNQPCPAIYVDSSSPKISNCYITDPYPNYSFGEAVEIQCSTNNTASPIIANNAIIDCAYIGIYDGGNGGSSLICGNYIYDSQFGIMSASKGTLTENLFVNNQCGVSLADIWVNGTEATNIINRSVLNNTFVDNDIGIGDGTFYNATGIMYNNFENNILNLQSGSGPIFFNTQFLDTPYNWWGTTDMQAINQSINCPELTLNIQPILTAPNPNAPSQNYDPVPTPSPSPSVTPSPTTTSSATPNPSSTATPLATPAATQAPASYSTSNPTPQATSTPSQRLNNSNSSPSPSPSAPEYPSTAIVISSLVATSIATVGIAKKHTRKS